MEAFLYIWLALSVLGGLTLFILFLVATFNALKRCKPENRSMSPGLVFLAFVPVLSLAWGFVTVAMVSSSLRKEYTSRGMSIPGGFGLGLGMTAEVMAILGSVAGIVLNVLVKAAGSYITSSEGLVILIVGLLSLLFLITRLVLGFIYVGKVMGSSKKLA